MTKLLAITVFLLPLVANATDVIAHRGLTCGLSENSLTSIANAMRAGATGVELDVRVSADGIAYLFHNDKIENRRTDDLTFAQASALVASPLVTLDHALRLDWLSGYLLLDLKSVSPEAIGAVTKVFENTDLDPARVSFQSESLLALSMIRERLPGSKTYYVDRLNWLVPYVLPPSAKSLLTRVHGQNVNGVSVKGRKFIGRRFVDELKAQGLEVNVWTVNNPRRAVHYQSLGVDRIITDKVYSVHVELGMSEDKHDICASIGNGTS